MEYSLSAMDRIKVAFIYKGSNIFMTGKHFDNNYYNFFIKLAVLKNNQKWQDIQKK